MVSVMGTESEVAAAKQLHDELLPKMPAGSHDSAACTFCSPRETASEGAPVGAEDNKPQTVDLNDPAIKAVVEHRVATEIASLTAERDAAVKERDEKQTRIDVVEGEKVAAEQARDAAVAELTTEREKAASETAAASRRESRKAQLVEKIPHLGGNDGAWFAAEVAKEGDVSITRLDRIAAMSDEAFEPYVAEIAAAFEGVEVKPGPAVTTPPRETAMAATSVPAAPAAGGESKASQLISSVGYGGVIRR